MGGANLGQVSKDFKLEVGDLGNSLDDEVDGREVLNLRGAAQSRSDIGGLVFCDSLLGNVLGEEFVYTAARLELAQEK